MLYRYKLCTSVLYLSLCIPVYTVHSIWNTPTVNVKSVFVCCVNEPVLPHFGYTFSYCSLYQVCFQNSHTLLICIFFFLPYLRSTNFESNIFFELREKHSDVCHKGILSYYRNVIQPFTCIINL
jgi:hypothetical protein